MIRLLTEIEDETVQMETLAHVYDDAERVLDTLHDEDEALEYLENVQEQCMQLGCWLHTIDPVGFCACGKKLKGDPFYDTVCAAGELDFAYPDYNHEENLSALRHACLHYMDLWHGNMLSRDIGRIQTDKDLRSADMFGYRLIGDSVTSINRSTGREQAYNAAWLSPDGMNLLMTISRKEGDLLNTYIYPFRYGMDAIGSASSGEFTKS